MDKREQILEAAANLIAEYGLQSSPVSQVAKIACCGTGTIYRYFETKESLIEELFVLVLQRLTSACLQGDDSSQATEWRLKHIWANSYNYLHNNQRDCVLLDHLTACPSISEEVHAAALKKIYSVLFTLLDQGKADGIIKDLPNEVLATFAYGGLATIAKKSRVTPQMMSDPINNDLLTQLCWDAIRV
jgi:TetR/AcrR family transcriptional repressor of multidrug resistance operon